MLHLIRRSSASRIGRSRELSLTIESGGGLSLALGMALSSADRPPVTASADNPTDHARTAVTAVPDAPAARTASPDTTRTPAGQVGPDSPAEVVGPARTLRPGMVPTIRTEESPVVAWLAAAGGRTEGIRRMAEALGRPRSTVSDECRRLAATGQLTMTRGRHGTVVALVTARVN